MAAEDAIREVAVQSSEEAVAEAVVPVLGNTVATFALAGSSSTQRLKVRISGFNLTTDQPAVVLVQPRQSDNRDNNFPDQFAVQVITTARNSILVEVRRLDGASGWGQNLRLDLFIVDRVVNP